MAERRGLRGLAAGCGILMASLAMAAAAAEPRGGHSRMATYTTPAGDQYFALAVQPDADEGLRASLGEGPRSVVVVVDTSASQMGPYRDASLALLDQLLAGLDPQAEVLIAAVDVKATAMASGFAPAEAAATREAIDKLKRRLPLGNTDLASALQLGQSRLAKSSGHRSLVYIGDGASMGEIRDVDQFAGIVDQLRRDRIAVHSIAIGPTTDVATLATLANHTGGVVLTAEPDEGAGQVGGAIASAVSLSPIWPVAAALPRAAETVQAGLLPPLRLDRDTLLIGTSAGDVSGRVTFQGQAGSSPVQLSWDVDAEESHPDFSFLPAMVQHAQRDRGLTLPTAGSAAMREAARALNNAGEEMARAGTLALQQGNARGASAVAEKALQLDPGNPEAKAIARLADESVLTARMQQEGAESEEILAQRQPLGNQPLDDELADLQLLEPPSELMGRVEAERAAIAGRMRAEVRAQLAEARRRLSVDPVGVTGALKTLLGVVDTEPNLPATVRQELRSQVQAAIREASRREAIFYDEQATLQQREAAAAATMRLLEEGFRAEARLAQVADQFGALVAEGRFDEAAREVAPQIVALAEGRTIGPQVSMNSRMVSAAERHERYRDLRHLNFVEVLALGEKALIPFVDEPPIVYPDAEVWHRLSRRRLDRYGAVELMGDDEAERRINFALGEEYSGEFFTLPLEEVVRSIAVDTGIPIIIDARALEEQGLSGDVPVTMNLQNVRLRSFLRIMLQELDLTYMIKDEVLQITTREAAEENLITKVYPVGDLVVPIINLGMMGGGMMGGGMMGGGMMGGMGGGMMGGMGGGMMGGMGGGMGMGGMGMGGMMAVPDEASLSEKAPPAPTVRRQADPIRLSTQGSQSQQEVWAEYFEGLQLDSAAQQARHDAQLRATVHELNAKARGAMKANDRPTAQAHYRSIAALIAAALQHGHVQPWMYQGYALALEVTGGDPEEIERALLSAADFAESVEDLLHVVRHLERVGSEAAALRLCRDVARIDPNRPDVYLTALRLARSLDDLDALQWACTGVLGQAWPKGQEELENRVRLTVRATYQGLLEEGRQDDAKQFEQAIRRAAAHDAIVRVTWTGDADVDILIEEPSGTVCSIENPRSAGGGVLLGDAFPGAPSADTLEGISETYLCPQGFSGKYRVLVRRVWGEVATGHVTVDVLTDVGRPTQRYVRRQIPLADKDALVEFEVKEGRRQEEIAVAQLQQIQQQRLDLGNTILAQHMGPLGSDTGAAADLHRDLQRLALARRLGFGRGAVGFRPEIQSLPEGAMLMGMAVISADRRYVRISPAPMFSQIGDVTTFNFVSGEEGIGTGGGMGGGLGGGGFGGGMMGGMGGF